MDGMGLSFPVTVVKYPDKGTLMEKQLILPHSSRIQSIVEGKGRHQELEAAPYIAPTMRKQRMVNACMHAAT